MNETSAVSTGALTSESLLAADSQVTGYLTFNLSAEEYGLDILKVQEIKRYEMLARLPDAASYVKGVFNLRGKIVPVVDMRVRFNLANVEYGEFTVMIILNVADRTFGIVVDGVSDVIQLTPEQIQRPPDMGASSASQFIMGIGTLDNRTLILMDIEKLISAAHTALIDVHAQPVH